MNTRSNY